MPIWGSSRAPLKKVDVSDFLKSHRAIIIQWVTSELINDDSLLEMMKKSSLESSHLRQKTIYRLWSTYRVNCRGDPAGDIQAQLRATPDSRRRRPIGWRKWRVEGSGDCWWKSSIWSVSHAPKWPGFRAKSSWRLSSCCLGWDRFDSGPDRANRSTLTSGDRYPCRPIWKRTWLEPCPFFFWMLIATYHPGAKFRKVNLSPDADQNDQNQRCYLACSVSYWLRGRKTSPEQRERN